MKSRCPLIFLYVALLGLTIIGSCDKLSEDVLISEIPYYYHVNHYLDNKVKEINDAIDECSNCDTFFWITDIHWEPDLNTRKSPMLIKYIASKTGVDKVLNGGDTGNSQVICKNSISQLRNAIGSNKVYTVTGNHEINDASRYERPFHRVADELRGHNSDIIYGDENQSYFYFDYISTQTRFIGLSSFGLFLDNHYESCYTSKQLKWFMNDALNVEADWTIIIFTHSLYIIDINTDKIGPGPTGANDFIDAIDNYTGRGKIACVLMGDSHRDRIHIGRTGVPYILSASDRHASYHGDINVERIPGTISEQHFEVVVIDKEIKQVKLFSIGANARDGFDNVQGKEVEVRVVNY